MKIGNFKSDGGKSILKEIQHNKELIKLGFSGNVLLVCNLKKKL